MIKCEVDLYLRRSNNECLITISIGSLQELYFLLKKRALAFNYILIYLT